MVHKPAPEFTAKYIREYGIHPVDGLRGTDYIASFGNFDDLRDNLKSNLPTSGNVVTPEYIAGPDNLFEATENSKLINEHIKEIKSLSKKSDAVIHLGAPLKFSEHGQEKWYNSVLSMQRGKITGLSRKRSLLPIEHSIGMTEPPHDTRPIKLGSAVLICAELYMASMDDKNILHKSPNVDQVLTPAMWATPTTDGLFTVAIEKAGGPDNYYRQQLEQAVGNYLLGKFYHVNQVIVSDRGNSEIPPYNAVFDRVHH